MALKHGKNFKITVNSVNLSSYASSGSLSLDVDTAETTTAGDSAKTFLEGDYTHTHSLSGPADFNTGTSDATLFALIGGGATSWVWQPESASAAVTNPTYTGSVILTNYTLNFDVGSAVNYSASGQGTSTQARATS